MSRADNIFYCVVAGFVVGILVRSFVSVGESFAAFLLLLAGVLFLVNRKTALVSVFFLCVALGMFRYDLADRKGPQTALDAFVGQMVTLEGLVVIEPDLRERVVRLVIQGLTLEPLQGQSFKVLVTTATEPKYAYGDRVSVLGVLERPENFTPTPIRNELVWGFTDETTLREVNYRQYLAKDGIYYEMFLPSIEVLARGEGNPLVAALFAFKHAFISRLNALIPEPHAALLAGLVVGAKQSLGEKLLDDFRTVGVIHIVVLSGFNITIIARFIEWALSALSRNRRLILAACCIILFAMMVGASATVVRATVMALIVLLARGTGRVYAVTRALLIAGALMLVHNPQILVFDTSFQLSFLATVGLIYLSPLLEPRVRFITERWGLREIVVATVATQLFVLPFLLYKTGILSLVSLPVNLLILAAVPATMLFGFLSGILSFAWSVLALPFAWIAYALLAYELAVVEWFARLPFAAVALTSFPFWLVALWYAGYGVVIMRFKNPSPKPLPL